MATPVLGGHRCRAVAGRPSGARFPRCYDPGSQVLIGLNTFAVAEQHVRSASDRQVRAVLVWLIHGRDVRSAVCPDPGINIDQCRASGSSSGCGCGRSSRLPRRHWSSGAAATLRTSCASTFSGPRAWSLDGQPLLGISVFAVLGEPLDDLLRRRFATFRTIYLPTAGRLAEYGFELLPTAQRPHFTVRLHRADDQELVHLLEALGAAQPNPAYPGSAA